MSLTEQMLRVLLSPFLSLPMSNLPASSVGSTLEICSNLLYAYYLSASTKNLISTQSRALTLMFTHLFSLVSKHSYASSDMSPVLWLFSLLLLSQVKREDFESIFWRQYRQINKWVFFLLDSIKIVLDLYLSYNTPTGSHFHVWHYGKQSNAPSKDVHIRNHSIHECGTLHGTRDFEDMMKLRIWRWGDWSRLCMWIQYNHRILIKSSLEGQSQRRRCDNKRWGWSDSRKRPWTKECR